MRCPLLRPVLSCLLPLLVTACGGSKGGGDPETPPTEPGEPPVLSVPAGLTGISPSYQLVLPIADTRSLLFTATDPEGALLRWQFSVSAVGSAATGLVYTSPTLGTAFQLQIDPVANAAAVSTSLLVEDPRGNAAAIDLLIVRSGPPAINAITPSSAFTTRPQGVRVTGGSFSLGGLANVSLAFDGVLAPDVVVLDDTTLTANTPASAAAGPAIVGVSTLYGTASLPAAAFTMHAFPPAMLANDVRIDAGGASSFEVARDDRTLHATWLEGASVVHRTSTDGGVTWSSPQTLSGAEAASEPQVAFLGSQVTVVWIGDQASVRTRRSLDGGATFSPVQRLDSTTTIAPARRPRLATSGSNRCVAWLTGTEALGTARVLAAGSIDNGATWSTPNPIANGGANQANHEIACDGSTAYVLCEDTRLPGPRGAWIVRTLDAGVTWLPAVRLDVVPNTASLLRLAARKDRVFASWVQNGILVVRQSSDRGVTWGTILEVENAQGGAVSEPQLTCDDNQLMFVYVIGGTTTRTARLPLTSTIPQFATLDATPTVSSAPVLAGDGNYVFAAWREGDVASGAARINFAVSTDSGATFEPAAGFGDGTAAQDQPRLAIESANLFLGWIDVRGATSGVFTTRTAN
jgi:hypothetical protein